jgi:2',3'-cyclic-nucleotide 2'-phosphodiesterase (5'-nucleotidase family)
MKKSILLGAALLSLAVSLTFAQGTAVAPNDGRMTLQILATSDSHGRFLPYDYAVNSPNNQGSLVQIASAINHFRSDYPDTTIVVDAGDIIQDNSASLFLNDQLNPMVLAMNQIGYDTVTLGNHEFNYGVPALKKILSQFKGTVLCGNVYNSDGTRLAAPYTILTRGGVKIGIIGMVTPNIVRWDASNLQGYKVTNPVDETKAAIAELKKAGVDLIIAVEHMGETGEYGTPGSSAMDVLDQCPEIDAFVAAHFHVKVAGDYFYDHELFSIDPKTKAATVTAMDGSTSPSSMDAFNQAKAKGVVIVEPYKWGQSICKVTITMSKDSAGKYIVADKASDISPALYDMATKGGIVYQPDSALATQLQPYSQRAIDDANSPIGTLAGGDLSPVNEIAGIEQSKLQPTAMIDLINKVEMYYGKQIANHAIDIASAAVFKDGQNVKAGKIKKCDAANIYMFDNTLYVLKVTGSQLRKYMEWSASYYNTYKPGDLTVSFDKSIPGYNYDMFSGVRYKIDISKAPGKRIIGLTRMNGKAIADADILYLALNNYRAGTQLLTPGIVFAQGEALPVLVGKSEQTPGLGDGRLRDLVGSYIQSAPDQTIRPTYENNWGIVGNKWDQKQRALAVKYINDGKIGLPADNAKAVTWDDVQKAMAAQ